MAQKKTRPRRLNVNLADVQSLAEVPGLDAALAERILARRPFGKLKELLTVPGVSLEIFQTASPHLSARAVKRAKPKKTPAKPAKAPARNKKPAASRAQAAPPAAVEDIPAAPPPVADEVPAAPPTPVEEALTPPPAAPLEAPEEVEEREAADTAEAPGETGVKDSLPKAPPPDWAEPAEVGPRPGAAAQAKHAKAVPYSALSEVDAETATKPPVIIIQPQPPGRRELEYRPPAPLAPPKSTGQLVARLLFESYAGPRLIFALLSVVLVLMLTGLFTGQLALRFPRAAASPTVDAVSTQVGAALVATLTAMPTPVPTVTVTPTPEPTLTPVPTEEPAPTPTDVMGSHTGLAGAGEPLFNETFQPAGYWDVGENDFSQSFIAGGQLSIRMKLPQAIAWASNGFTGDDFYYQGTAQVGECVGGDYYGLTFRVQNDDNLYLFGLSCDGLYRLVQRVNGEFRILINFTFTPYANIGSNARNLLGIRAQGSTLNLYVNDEFVASIGVAEVNPGRFGIFAKSAQTSNLQVDFDDLSAWRLNP